MTLKLPFICACLALATAAPAWADFNYVPATAAPPASGAAPAYAPVEAAPLAPSAGSPPSAIMPRSTANAPSAAAMTAPLPLRDTTANLNASEMGAPTPIAPAAPARPARLSGGSVVQGFGNQIPLVIALRQIVPESYQFAYGTNVPLGSMVDWHGGRPWKDVLMDVLTPLGLTASESGTLIHIDRM